MRYIWTAVGGMIVGAATALLLAPATGRTTRGAIRDGTTRYSSEVRDFVEGKSEHLRNKAAGYRHKIEEMARCGRESMDGAEEDTTRAASLTESSMGMEVPA